MISIRQLDANRRNAQKSTGPKTPEGRAAVRNNAVTHALTAQNPVLPDESKEEFDAFFAAFEAEYQPAGPTETLLLTQLVNDAWRLQRIRTMEIALFDLAMRDYAAYFAKEYKDTTANHFHAYVFREDARGADVFSRQGRYESRTQRNFYRSLHELQRLQSLPATPSIHNPEPPPSDPINTPPPTKMDFDKTDPFPKPDTTAVSPSPTPPVSPSPRPQLRRAHKSRHNITTLPISLTCLTGSPCMVRASTT